MSLWDKVRGTIETIFQLGLGGPQLKNNSGVVEFRNSGDSGYVIARGASPQGDNDLTTKQYVDTVNKPIVITQQFNGGSSLPANTSVEQFYIVTTSGINATIGQLLWDDGQNTGIVTVLTALEGRTVFTSQSFSGGTITLTPNAFYVWDTVSSSWLLEANATAGGATLVVRYTITNANGSQDSASTIPANAVVSSAWLKVTTPFSGGATLAIGQAGNTTLLQATTDNLPQAVGIYKVSQDTAWGGSALAVRTTVAGTPAAGAGVVIVFYSIPNA